MMRKFRHLLISAAVLVGLVGIVFASLPAGTASAATPSTCPPGYTHLKGSDTVCCPISASDSGMSCLYAKYINPVISILSVMAGLAAVIGIVIGGIQYASSAGDSQKAAAARSKITKAAAGFITFLFLYSLLQFFSPGGISTNTQPQGSGSLAQRCSRDFLTLKPWFVYLPDSAFNAQTCQIENFSLLGEQDASGKTVKQSQLILVVLAILDNLVRLAGIVAVGFVIMGGVLFVTSQGDPEKAKRARMSIFNALIGVVIAIIAASVISYIGTQLSS